MVKKRDSLCFDIENLSQEQKIQIAKNFKKTQEDFNKEISKSNQQDKDSKNES